MLRNAAAERAENPIVKVLRYAVSIDVHALDEAHNAFLDDLRRQPVGVRLEVIRCGGGFRVDSG